MKKQTIYFIAIPLLAVALVIGGGWWANRAGLLGQSLAPVAQTASSVSAGVAAQPGQSGRPGQTGMITGTMTMTMPVGGGSANGFPPPPDGMGAPGGPPTASAPLTTTVPLSGTAAGVDSGTVSVTETVAESASTPATSVAAAKVAAIPAVAGVGGSRLYAADGTLLVTLDSGATVLVTGRSADDTWLSVTGGDSGEGTDGWIEATQLIVYGLHRLAVTDVPLLPAAVQAAAGTADAGSLASTSAVTVTPVLLVSDTLAVSAALPSQPVLRRQPRQRPRHRPPQRPGRPPLQPRSRPTRAGSTYARARARATWWLPRPLTGKPIPSSAAAQLEIGWSCSWTAARPAGHLRPTWRSPAM